MLAVSSLKQSVVYFSAINKNVNIQNERSTTLYLSFSLYTALVSPIKWVWMWENLNEDNNWQTSGSIGTWIGEVINGERVSNQIKWSIAKKTCTPVKETC